MSLMFPCYKFQVTDKQTCIDLGGG